MGRVSPAVSKLAALFFIVAAAMGTWMVPLSTILRAYNLDTIRPFAFCCFAIAYFISPLVLGALADRNVSPVKIMRWNAIGAAITIALIGISLHLKVAPLLTLVAIFAHALFYAPAWALASTIVLAQLPDVPNQFGPIRAMATIGWMTGCWAVSMAKGDSSSIAPFISCTCWLLVAAITYFLPHLGPVPASKPAKWYERLGIDALKLLHNNDHRMIFLVGLLFSIPVAAFYPYTPLHLQSLGLHHTSGWMTLGQVSEVFSMFMLGWLLKRFRIKWIIGVGLFFGVLRFLLCSGNTVWSVLLGIFLHGISLTLVTITAQVYVDQRVDPQWRARAQSLLTLMNSGVGNLVGYLATAKWFSFCLSKNGLGWQVFWLGIASFMAIALAFFIFAYKGLGKGVRAIKPIQIQRKEI